MATPNQTKPTPAAAPVTPQYTSPLAGKKRADAGPPRGNQNFLFDKGNYMWMLIGVGCIILGFFLLSGGKSPDPHVFLKDEIYSARRITISPILILIGFGIEAYAIMKKPVAQKEATV